MSIGFRVVAISLLLPFFVGCIAPHIAVVKQTNPRGWGGSDTIFLYYDSVDTLSLSQLSLVLRLNKSYNEQELVISITTSDSTKNEVVDKIEITNIHHKEGFSRYTNVVIPFRDRAKLKSGRYKFGISHNKKSLKALHSIGVEIVPSR